VEIFFIHLADEIEKSEVNLKTTTSSGHEQINA
jgi:hypothetical protein